MPQSSNNHPTMPLPSHNDATFDTALQWELDWVMGHPEGYDGPWHQRAVCGNITKRYAATKLTKLINHYAETRTTGAQLALFEHLGVLP